MSISLDGNNLIINTTSNAISIICSSDYTRVSNLNVPLGFLAPTTLITPSVDAIIGMSGKVTCGSGTISDVTTKDLGATYTFTSPGIYLINLYVYITPSDATITIINCGLGLSTSASSFTEGTGQINCYSIARCLNNTTQFTATVQKVITVGANVQHYFLINMDIDYEFAYANPNCYWTYIKIG